MSKLQPRRIAREVALLSLSQIKGKIEKIEKEELNTLLIGAIRTLRSEVDEALEAASAEVQRANEQLLQSELRATTQESTRTMLKQALELTQISINRIGAAVEIPEFIQLSNQVEVRQYAIDIITTVKRRQQEINVTIDDVLEEWQFSRIPQIDQDILRIAVAEIVFLDIPHKVAINEAVEIAKRYSDKEGYRFINGILRKVVNQMGKTEATALRPGNSGIENRE